MGRHCIEHGWHRRVGPPAHSARASCRPIHWRAAAQVVRALEAPGAVPGLRPGANYILLRKTQPRDRCSCLSPCLVSTFLSGRISRARSTTWLRSSPHAMGCVFSQSTERGIIGDYVGESFGMHLDLRVSPDNPPPPRKGTEFLFMGGAKFEKGSKVAWTDISGYVAQILTRRTGMTWDWSASAVSHGAPSPSS